MIAGRVEDVSLKAGETRTEYDAELGAGGGAIAMELLHEDRLAGEFSVRIAERVYFVKEIKRSRGGVTFAVNGRVIDASFPAEGQASASPGIGAASASSSSVASVSENVVANFPAKVVKVSVSPGEKVEGDRTIIVLEAMKMEAHIKAPKACVVTEILAKEGDIVPRGALLARLKFL